MDPSSTNDTEALVRIGDLVDNQLYRVPNMELFKLEFWHKTGQNRDSVQERVAALIGEYEMGPFYKQCVGKGLCEEDVDKMARLERQNQTQMDILDHKCKDALGTFDALEAKLRKAIYLVQIGDKNGAFRALRKVQEQSGNLGTKIDVTLCQLRIGYVFNDSDLISRSLTKVEDLLELGVDWDRKNRFRAYKALYHFNKRRDFGSAIELFVEALPTFTSSELISYHDLVKLSIVSGMIVFSRIDLKTKIVDCAEVEEVIHDMSEFRALLTTFYNCEYAEFFVALMNVEPFLRENPWSGPHHRYIVEELKLQAYKQFLYPYVSVGVGSMANVFGVTEQFVESELFREIAAKRLDCSIDGVARIVHRRVKSPHAQYQALIRHGDKLVDQLQNLGRVINA